MHVPPLVQASGMYQCWTKETQALGSLGKKKTKPVNLIVGFSPSGAMTGSAIWYLSGRCQRWKKPFLGNGE